jgi:hypothetical protein
MNLVDAVDGLVEVLGRRTTRRRVLQRAAVAGAAMTVAPAAFALRPGTAYAAICGCSGQACDCGSLCCDGYTEFCCTMSGVNRCPAGTLLGGWWKVDGSEFCGGGPRYYLDCNAQCGGCGCGSSGICGGSCSGTPCGCAQGSCGNRKSGCTGFRYGQCHQEVACLGPIVCRVVTCSPPWELDGTCGTAARTDNATRYHNRPCLQGAPIGHLEIVESVPGGVRLTGWAADPDIDGPTEVHAYIGSAAYNLGPADRRRDDVAAAYPALGPNHGFDMVVPDVRDGVFDVCVYAINAAGPSGHTLLECRSTRLSRGPFGNLDLVGTVPGGLRVAGWAIDPDTAAPVEVHVYAGGGGANLGLADEDRPDVGAAFPAYGPAHGFSGELPVNGSGVIQVCAYGLNASGPGQTMTIACRPFDFHHGPFGSFDGLSRVPGGLRVSGWAIDPDTPDPIEVHVYAGGGGTNTGLAQLPRPDVGRAFPGYGDAHGFDAEIPWSSSGSVEVCVYGINVGSGANTRIGCRTIQVMTSPFGSLEHLGRTGTSGLRIVGWAIDPDTADPIEMHVYVNGGGYNLGLARLNRPDVAEAFPGYGPHHGFDHTLSSMPAGPLDVCVYAINSGAGAHTLFACARIS